MCLLQPVTPFRRMARASATSVDRLPVDLMAAMTRDRCSVLQMSMLPLGVGVLTRPASCRDGWLASPENAILIPPNLQDSTMATNRSRAADITPSPGRLLNSLRDVGYDFVTAVADLVDNSLAAQIGRASCRERV